MGFAVTSCFLSMWISNVATMALMIPIVEAILVQMETSNLLDDRVDSNHVITENEASGKQRQQMEMQTAGLIGKRNGSEEKIEVGIFVVLTRVRYM